MQKRPSEIPTVIDAIARLPEQKMRRIDSQQRMEAVKDAEAILKSIRRHDSRQIRF